MVFRYCLSSIFKYTRSSLKQYHKVFYSFTSQLYINQSNTQQDYIPQKRFQSIIKSQPNIYYSLCLHQSTHAPSPLRTFPSPPNPPQLLLLPRLIWFKLTLPLQSKKYSPVSLETLPNKMQNFRSNMQHCFISITCRYISKNTIKIFHQNNMPKRRHYLLLKRPIMNAFIKWVP